MNREEFKKIIESIGFETNDRNYVYIYKKIRIDLFFIDHYDFFNGSEWTLCIPFNDLTQLEKYFKKELRSFKLKGLLG